MENKKPKDKLGFGNSPAEQKTIEENKRRGYETLIAQVKFYKEHEGITKFSWSYANDEFACEICKARHGKITPYEEIMEQITNQACTNAFCRCAILPEVD